MGTCEHVCIDREKLNEVTIHLYIRACLIEDRLMNIMVMTHPSLNRGSGEFTGIEGQGGKNMCQGGKPDTGKFHSSYIGIYECMLLRL